MTLNITVFSKDFVLQASDRCISAGGVPVDEWNKAVVFLSKQVRAALTYTGVAGRLERQEVGDLAEMPKPPGTVDWLADRMCRAEGAEWDLRELADQIRQAADDLFSTLPQECVDRRTAFTLAGWDGASSQPRGYHIHNCLDEHARMTSDCRSVFTVQAVDPSQPDHYAGISDAVHRRRRKRIREALRSGAPVERVVESILQAVRSAASIQRFISADCLTILLPPKGNPQARFHAAGESSMAYGPTTVVCGGDNKATYVIGDPQVDMPEGWTFELGDYDGALGTLLSRG
jgi:hypothetical protein